MHTASFNIGEEEVCMEFQIGQSVVFTVEGAQYFPEVRAPIYGTGSKQVYEIIKVYPEQEVYDLKYKDPFSCEGFTVNGVKERFLMGAGLETDVICRHCSELRDFHSFRRLYNQRSVGEAMCSDCIDAIEHEVCDHCGTVHAVGAKETWEIEGKYFCQCCVPSCYDCGAPVNIQDPNTGRWFCLTCYNELTNIDYIKPYNFKPIFTKFGQTDDNRYFGIELEIDGGGEDNDNWRRLRQKFPEDFVYAMHDGSLSNGFEIATQPATLEYLYGIDWEAFRNKCADMGYRSHNTSTCGLHVHVDVSAFGLINDEQDLRIGRILYFFSRFKLHLLRFSRRSQASMDRWAMIEPISSDDEDYIINKVKTLKYEDKYRAINLNHQQSVEFRVFRGTLNPKTIKATLQFVDALIDIATMCSLSDIQTKNWSYFVETFFTKPELKEYLELHEISCDNIPETVVVPPNQTPPEIHPLTDDFLQECVDLIYDNHSDAYNYLSSAPNYDKFIDMLLEEYDVTSSTHNGVRDIGAFLEALAELSRTEVPPIQCTPQLQELFRSVKADLQSVESRITDTTKRSLSEPSFSQRLRNTYTRRLYTLFTGAPFPRQVIPEEGYFTHTATPQNIISNSFYNFSISTDD